MRASEKLAELISLQKLRELSCCADLARTQRVTTSKASQLEHMAHSKEVAAHALSKVYAADVLCPDRMLLAVGQLALADASFLRGREALDDAHKAEESSRNEWRSACSKSGYLASFRKAAKRSEVQKSESRSHAEHISLHVALGRGNGQ